jgi:hypothetical protein
MSHSKALYHWQQRLATFFTELSPQRRTWLALVSFGIVLAQSALLNTVCLKLALALGQSLNTLRQRLRKLYRPLRTCDGRENSFDAAACFVPLLRWATSGFTQKRLALAIDPTYLGDRFIVLTASVVFRGGAVPVAWHVQVANAKGSWNDHWQRLLGRLHQALDGQWEVLVLSDRGLESGTLFEAITSLGWHPLQRAKKAGHFRPDGWVHRWPMSRFAAQVGRHWKGRGVVWPESNPLSCTLLACWDEGHEDAWLILTDLAPAKACAVWYAFRSWIEHGFRDLKSDGWQLSKTRMTDPERVARWWSAVALATLWVMETGQQAQEMELPATKTHNGKSGPAVTSLFALGLSWLVLQLSQGRIGRWYRLQQPKWRKDHGVRDKLSEKVWLEEHQKIPL